MWVGNSSSVIRKYTVLCFHRYLVFFACKVRQACSSHHHIVIWMYQTQQKHQQILRVLRRQCCRSEVKDTFIKQTDGVQEGSELLCQALPDKTLHWQVTSFQESMILVSELLRNSKGQSVSSVSIILDWTLSLSLFSVVTWNFSTYTIHQRQHASSM